MQSLRSNLCEAFHDGLFRLRAGSERVARCLMFLEGRLPGNTLALTQEPCDVLTLVCKPCMRRIELMNTWVG